MTSEAGGGFLGRWSRRKQAERERPAGGGDAAPAVELPDVETLHAGSDFTVFLRKGVAAAVQARALQKAWTSDAVMAAAVDR